MFVDLVYMMVLHSWSKVYHNMAQCQIIRIDMNAAYCKGIKDMATSLPCDDTKCTAQ